MTNKTTRSVDIDVVKEDESTVTIHYGDKDADTTNYCLIIKCRNSWSAEACEKDMVEMFTRMGVLAHVWRTTSFTNKTRITPTEK